MSLPTLTKLSVSGFKSIHKEQSIAIRPLTILAGANSSGKSSMIQPLLLLKQTIEAQGEPSGILLDGPNAHFTTVNQLLSKSAGSKSSPYVRINLALDGEGDLGVVLLGVEGSGLEVAENSWNRPDRGSGRLRFGMDPTEALHSTFNRYGYPPDQMKPGIHYTTSVERNRHMLVVHVRPIGGEREETWADGFRIAPLHSTLPMLQHLIHVPGIRGNAQRTYPRRATGPKYSGTFDPYVASVIARWQEEKDNDKLKALQQDLSELGLTWKVEASRVDDTQISLRVGRLPQSRRGGSKDLVDIADVGFGVSQSLPVLVALIAAEPGQVVYLEQPEIHLHPLAQRRLANVLSRAAIAGKTVIVETHSALLLREVQTLIAHGTLTPDQVAFHWFTRDEQGHTSVQTAEIAEDGSYGPWPTDFDSTELESEMAYLDAVEAREQRK